MLFLYHRQNVGILTDEVLRGAHVRDRPAIGVDPRAGVNADNNTCADRDALARRRPTIHNPAA